MQVPANETDDAQRQADRQGPLGGSIENDKGSHMKRAYDKDSRRSIIRFLDCVLHLNGERLPNKRVALKVYSPFKNPC